LYLTHDGLLISISKGCDAECPSIAEATEKIRAYFRTLDDPESVITDYVCNPACKLPVDTTDPYIENPPCSIQMEDGYKLKMQYDEAVCRVAKSLKKCVKTDNNEHINTVEPDSNTGAIVGGVVGGIAGVALIGAGAWFGYKWYKNRDNNIDNVEA
jgi:hypothetical protein